MSSKTIPRIMIVIGDDTLAIGSAPDEYAASIEQAHGQCVVELFDPSSEKIDVFLSRAMTASLFQEVRLFKITFGSKLPAESDLAALGQMLSYEIPDVYIFISAEIEKKNEAGAKLEKALGFKKLVGDKTVTIIKATKPYDNKLAEWIIDRAAKKFNRKIGKADAQAIADSVEYDQIDSELRKIDMALKPGAPIDKKVIDEIVGITRVMSEYELAGALGRRDLVTALQAAGSIFSCGDFHMNPVLAAIFRHFWSMLRVRKYIEKNPDILRRYNGGYNSQSEAAFDIGMACGILGEKDTSKSAYPKVIKSGIVGHSQKFSSRGLLKILNMLQRFDVDIKTGRAEPTLYGLQMLCYKIVRTA